MGNILSVSFMSILLDILGIIAVIALGSIIVVVVAELILHLLGGGKKSDNKNEEDNGKSVVKDDDIVVYSNQDMPVSNEDTVKTTKSDTLDGEKIEEIDYDKAIEEQKMLQSKQGVVKAQAQPVEEKPVEPQPEVVEDSVKGVKAINKDVKVLCGAGITTGDDMKAAMDLGADGVLLASGIIKAESPKDALLDLVSKL